MSKNMLDPNPHFAFLSCGGPLETSIIAREKSKIFVANRQQKEWVEFNMVTIKEEPMMKKLMSWRKITDFEVVISPDDINRISKRYKVTPDLEKSWTEAAEKIAKESLSPNMKTPGRTK